MPPPLAQVGPSCCKIWHREKDPAEIFPSPSWYFSWPFDGVTQVETLKSWNKEKSPEYKKVWWKKYRDAKKWPRFNAAKSNQTS